MGEDRECVGWSALLHDDGDQPGVRGAGCQNSADHAWPQPWIQVVDVGFQQYRRVAGLTGWPRCGLTDHHAGDVRSLVGVLGAGADAGPLDGEWREVFTGVTKGSDQRHSGWCGEFSGAAGVDPPSLGES